MKRSNTVLVDKNLKVTALNSELQEKSMEHLQEPMLR